MRLTPKQWFYVRDEGLGLRSGEDAHDIGKAANYAMDIGEKGKFEGQPPFSWDALLQGTIHTIMAFPNAKERYLLIVTGVAPASWDYKETFPKSSSTAKSVLSATRIAEYERPDALVDWVVQHIPEKA
jgi:hypothetical protein